MSATGWVNPFDLLGEDDSGDGIATGKIPVQPAAKKEDKPAPKPAAAAKPAAKEEAKPARKTGDADNKESRPPRSDNRGGENRGENRGGDRRPPREFVRKDGPGGFGGPRAGPGGEEASGSPAQDRPPRQQPRGDRPGGSGERRDRRDRENGIAAGAGAVGPRRVYDRHSGTGRGREEKRGGAGRGNWGSVTDTEGVADRKPEEEGAATASNAEGVENAEAAAGESGETGAAPAAEKAPRPPRELTAEELARQAEREKEEKLMTLDEYLSKKKEKPAVGLPLPEARKAGEGEDQKQWAKFTAAGKADKSNEDGVAKTTAAPQDKKEKKGNKAAIDPALLKFKSDAARRARESEKRPDAPEGGRDRPDRPPRPERAPREQQQQQPKKAGEPAFDTARDFPSLK